MADRLKKYAFINAKLRARISAILPDEFFDNMISLHSLIECVGQLRQTSFSDVEKIYTQTGDLKMAELELYKNEIAVYREIGKYCTEDVRAFINSLTMRYEISNLKNILRLWFDKNIRKRNIHEFSAYLFNDRIIYDLHPDTILASSSWEELEGALKSTPYAELIKNNAAKVDQSKTLFPLEINLDRFYYQSLIKSMQDLDSGDVRVVKNFIGIEIDILNINWIIRLSDTYKMPIKEIRDYILPHGQLVSPGLLNSDKIDHANAAESITGLVSGKYQEFRTLLSSGGKNHASKVLLVEQVLEMVLQKEIRKILAGYPFTIGIIMAYCVLKSLEIRKIMTILNAKYYGISAEKIQSML